MSEKCNAYRLETMPGLAQLLLQIQDLSRVRVFQLDGDLLLLQTVQLPPVGSQLLPQSVHLLRQLLVLLCLEEE